MNGEKRKLGLEDECRYLKGVGPARAAKLKKMGIVSVDDLITHFPRKYYDRRSFTPIAKLKPGEEANISGQLLSVAKKGVKGGRSIITAAVGDETSIVQVVWFNQDYLYKQLKPGYSIVLNGTPGYFRGARQIVNPEFEILSDELDRELLHAGRIVPVYRLTAGVSQRFLRQLIRKTLDEMQEGIFENLPQDLISSLGMPQRRDALRAVHFPEDGKSYEAALKRLKFEELFYLQLVFSLTRRSPTHITAGEPIMDFPLEVEFLRSLPFSLTSAQRRVLDEIKKDLMSQKGMHRLLQGEVGSGKTVIAGAALLCAVGAGFQGAFMAPTEILAVQHAKTLGKYFEPVGVPVNLLIGSMSTGAKRRIHETIARGDAKIIIGTHALIQEGVSFKDLGLVVIDEQHRFGVRQRASLLSRGKRPHLLVMTATPIPRTLALTAYADLDLSVLDELPPGRMGVRTHIVKPEKEDDLLEFVLKEVSRSARAYFLYPLIEETEKIDLDAAISAYEDYSRGSFKDVGVGLLHGKMPFDQKEKVMEEFAKGEKKLLVTTTVVEVGIDVPEATIMVVHNPERFGLSQLHQLRGRVGRGRQRGYCFLLLSEGVSGIGSKRLGVLTRTSDGFTIAEEDLKIRGPGEFFGTRQHGLPGFKLANPVYDKDIVEQSRMAVKELLLRDPGLECKEASLCRRYLEFYSSLDLGLVRGG